MNSLVHKYSDIYKLLTVIFMLYVVGDYITTMIAIDVSPLGIDGEANPIAVMLYTNYGSTSLLFAKLVMFSSLATITLFLLSRNIRIKHIVRLVLLIFSIFSAVIVSINMYSILSV